MKKSKSRKKNSELRVYSSNNCYSVIEVYYNTKGKITGYSDIIIPTGISLYDLKIILTKMISATRKTVLKDKDFV